MSSLRRRWDSEDSLITDVTASRSKTKGDGAYEPFSDPDVSFDVTKWPTGKPAPKTVTRWSGKTSPPAGTVSPEEGKQ